MTSSISASAAARREAARQSNGEFGEHTHSTPELALAESRWPENLGKTEHPGQWGHVDVEYGSRTPWGPAQHSSREAEGILFVPTEGHGGYKLSPERNAAIPAPFRNRNGFYEEDTERVFPEFFHHDALFNRPQDASTDREERLGYLDQKIRDYYPSQYEKVYGIILGPGESYEKDIRTWAEDNADEYVMTSQQSIEDGLILVTARRASTGDEDRFVLTPQQRDAARDEVQSETGHDHRFRIPAGLSPQPRPEPEPAKPAFTAVPSTEGLTAAAARKVQEDLNKRWRLRADGQVLTLRQQIEQGHITSKRVYVNASGTREFYLDNDNTSSALKVSKAMFDAFEAPDTRTDADRAMEEYQIAAAKRDKVQGKYDAQFRPSAAIVQELRAARAAADAAYARYKEIRGE